MKLIKHILAVTISLFSLLLPSCQKQERDYKLTITGHVELIIDGPHLKDDNKTLTYFNAGDVVVFNTAIVNDAEIIFKLNGQKMTEALDYQQDRHSFIMPNQDSILNIGLAGSYFDLNYAPLFHYYDWIKYLSEEEIASATLHEPCMGTPFLDNFDKYYSASKEEIHTLYDFLKNTYVEKVSYQPIEPGTVYHSIYIETKYGDEYQISANNGYINVSNTDINYSYRLTNPLPTFDSFKAYSLNDIASKGFTVTDENNDVTSSFNVDKLAVLKFEIIEEMYFPEVVTEYNRYRFINSWGAITFESSTLFVISDYEHVNPVICSIVNNLTFEDLKK